MNGIVRKGSWVVSVLAFAAGIMVVDSALAQPKKKTISKATCCYTKTCGTQSVTSCLSDACESPTPCCSGDGGCAGGVPWALASCIRCPTTVP